MAPLDEYDSYAPHIVSLVDQHCSTKELSAHLLLVQTEWIGVEANLARDEEIAKEIITALRGQGV